MPAAIRTTSASPRATCGNFYGGGDLNWSRIVPGTIRSVLRGKRPVVRSDGQFVRDYFYVEDGAAAYTLSAERLAADRELAGEAFNFSNEQPINVIEVTNLILKLMQSDLEPDIRNEATNEIRHQYLHFILDPFGLRFTLPRDTRIALTKFVENAPGIQDQYRKDLQFLIIESLIRAVELRMNKVSAVKASAELDSYTRGGALLSRHFYESLEAFEEGQEGMRVYYPRIVKSIELDKIEASFNAAVKAPVEKLPEVSEVQRLLEEANSNLGDDNLEKAKELFETVLRKHGAANGEALYGLGIVASIQNDRESAKECFQKALESSTSDKSIRVWSRIYLGRLHDVEGRRREALLEYQAAIDLGDNTRNAQEVAKRGLKEPFSSKKTLPLP